MSETMASGPRQFLADLAVAMRTAAEAGRQTSIEQCHLNADEYVERLRAEALSGQTALREASADDVVLLREQSKAQAQLVRDESERRIRTRREALDRALAEYTQALQAELQSVEQRTAAWEVELDKFYLQLADEIDPTVFASLASTMPEPPDFGGPDPAQLVRERQADAEPAQPAEAETSASLPDHWWLDSPTAIAERR